MEKWHPFTEDQMPVYHKDCGGQVHYLWCYESHSVIEIACDKCKPNYQQMTLPNIPADRQNFI